MKGSWRFFVAFFALAVAACSGTAPTSPAPTSSTPIQVSASPVTGVANADAPIFTVTGAEEANGGRGACVFNAATGQFDCPAQTREGLTITTRFTLYDAAGKVLTSFDRQATASIKTETTATGTTTRDGRTMTISRTGVMTTTGLGPNATTHTLNGTEKGTVVTTFTKDGVTTTTEAAVTGTTTNLVVPVAKGGERPGHPLSGTRVHETISTITRGTKTDKVTMVRKDTYNGTSTVQVEITVNGVMRQCTMDLEARTTTCGQR